MFLRRERRRGGDGDGGSAREENGRRVVIGWFAVGREMRKRGGGVEGLTQGMNGVSGEEDFDRKEVALRD